MEETRRTQGKDGLSARNRTGRDKAILRASALPLGFTQVAEERRLESRVQALNPARTFIACVCQGRCEQLSSHTDGGSQSLVALVAFGCLGKQKRNSRRGASLCRTPRSRSWQGLLKKGKL